MTTFRRRARRFWVRHRTTLWILHSIWALATGVVVIVLAHEQYGFIPWVIAFLVLTWASTLFFGHQVASDVAAEAEEEEELPPAPGMMEEVGSYLTRIMYQETLFFSLPFYAYSTVWGSPNVVFVVLLGALAVLSCLDLVFDRWLRKSPVFGLVFFATVAFGAINLVLPILWPLSPEMATPLAAAVAVVAAALLAWRTTRGRTAARLRLGVAAALFLALVTLLPTLVPPVPLRMMDATFATEIERETLTPRDSLGAAVDLTTLPEGLVVVARVFAPSSLPAAVSVQWKRDGTILRTSDEIDVVAHDAGFRIWDALRPGEVSLAAGSYEVVLSTRGSRVFGVARIEVAEGGGPS